MAVQSSTVPGLVYPTQQGMIGSNPRESAYLQMQNSATLQNNLNKAVGGKKYKYGGADTVQVPQVSVLYTPTGGPTSDPNYLIKQNAILGMQSAANAQYDSNAFKGGKYTNKQRKYTNKRRKYTNKRRKYSNKRKYTNKRRKYSNK